jgi:peptide chain release factor subunit 1
MLTRPLINRLISRRSLNNSTSLITFYVPPTTRLIDLNKMVNSEISKTPNIKSRQTRQGVQSSLQAISTHMKNMKTIPSNGVAIFSGPTTEGFESFIIEPPRPIDRFFYRCDNSFYV